MTTGSSAGAPPSWPSAAARLRASESYLTRRRPLLRALANLPYVQALCLSGSLAFDNLRAGHEDIDLLVITEGERLWLALATTWPLRRLRGRELCLNYLVSAEKLRLPVRRAFDAHQLIHLRPLSNAPALRAPPPRQRRLGRDLLSQLEPRHLGRAPALHPVGPAPGSARPRPCSPPALPSPGAPHHP